MMVVNKNDRNAAKGLRGGGYITAQERKQKGFLVH